jgi:hypothetical protein
MLLLAGCTPTAEVASSPSATPEPTVTAPEPTPTPEVVEPASVVVSLDTLSIRDAAGVELDSASFTDTEGVLALLSELLGSTPVPVDHRQHGMSYDWSGVSFIEQYGAGVIEMTAPELGGLTTSTSQGIHIGSSRAEVEALVPWGEFDLDGDGVSDWFYLEPREVPGTMSLDSPGQVGTAFIKVRLTGDVVTSLSSPANNFREA